MIGAQIAVRMPRRPACKSVLPQSCPLGSLWQGTVKLKEVRVSLNFRLTDIGTVPIGLPRNGDGNLAVRGLTSSRLISSEIRYGLTPKGGKTEFPRFPSWTDAYSVGITLQDQRSDIVVGGKRFSHVRRKGETQLLYVSGVEHIEFNTPRHGVEILLPRSFMREMADDLEVPHVTHLGRSFCHVVDDPVLRTLALRIYPFFDAPETLDPLQADHFIWALGIYVCSHYGGLAARRPVTGGLSSWQERLAKDMIETSLIGGIGLTELAVLCHLRTSQFAHAFKRSTGVAPYQWLMQRRIARAKDLIRAAGRETSLADVAVACGFVDQSHLTRAFARAVGKTPGAWRTAVSTGAWL